MNDFYGRPNQQFNTMYNLPYNGNYQPQPTQMRTNKIFVTSLEDALNRYAEPNTIMVYRHQDEKFEYEIITDGQGKKSYKTLQLGDYSCLKEEKVENTIIISQEELNGIKGRLQSLENEILKKYKETNGGIE